MFLRLTSYAVILVSALGWTAFAAPATFPCTDPNVGLSPYTWKVSGEGSEARAEATMPGAYLKTIVKGTATAGLVIDGTANAGCPAPSMPVIECSVDDGPFAITPLTRTDAVYTFPIATGLDAAASHKIEVYFRAADLGQGRWTTPKAHLRIAAIALDEGGTLAAYPKRAKLVIGFGDSITEGVGVDGEFKSWQELGVNNARGSWFPVVCAALDCEYGQFGSGGQGMVKVLEMPGLINTWDHYDSATSRLKDGLLLPEPDYVFCCMGTNDFGGINITSAYEEWLTAVRKACPNTHIFCVIPPSGVHRDEIQAAAATRNKAQDQRVHVIDTPAVNSTITVHTGATQMTCDGVHPTVYGNAIFGATVAAKAQAILSGQTERK